MARYVTTVATPLSPAEAFAYVADVRHFERWDPGVKRAVQVSGDGPAVGAAYDLTLSSTPAMTMRYDVTACEAPRRVLLVSKTRWLHSIDEIRVVADGEGAKVTYDAVLTMKGPLGLFDRILGLAFRRIGDRAAEGLRKALRGVTVPA